MKRCVLLFFHVGERANRIRSVIGIPERETDQTKLVIHPCNLQFVIFLNYFFFSDFRLEETIFQSLSFYFVKASSRFWQVFGFSISSFDDEDRGVF